MIAAKYGGLFNGVIPHFNPIRFRAVQIISTNQLFGVKVNFNLASSGSATSSITNDNVTNGSVAELFPTISLQDLIPLILKAVPKKKPSYRRTRQKLYAPGDKKIQPLNNIVRCPACGSVKRSHFMCMNCFAEIKQFLKQFKPKKASDQIPETDEIDEKLLYPGKKLTEYQRKLAKKDWIPVREKPLMFNSNQIKLKK